MSPASGSARRFRVAAVQMTSTEDVGANLEAAERLVLRAAAAGAKVVALPENFAFLRREGDPVPTAEPLDGPIVRRMASVAKAAGIWLLLGSIPEKRPKAKKIHNTSVLLDPEGDIAAVYRKMHLFDVRLRGKAVFEESKVVEPGDGPVVAATPLGRFGLSVCYDLRFPELYRRLVLDGAEVLFVPSAFTEYTGSHHWIALLRARAIENQCYVVAPAQTGRHNPKRVSFGHTAILDPWGTVVALLERGAGFAHAEIDFAHLDRVRAGLPCLAHVRPELLPKPSRRR